MHPSPPYLRIAPVDLNNTVPRRPDERVHSIGRDVPKGTGVHMKPKGHTLQHHFICFNFMRGEGFR